MLDLTQILADYPERLRIYPENILKEHLQYKILQSIYRSEQGRQLVFLGGTALRILHQNTRFSEDLDFDNLGLSETEFLELGEQIKRDLELEGLTVEVTGRTKQAYRLKIKIPEILFQEGLAPMETQKILIQVDTVPQSFDYEPERPILNKLDVFTPILATPKDLLLAQKIYASVNRKRLMGRDFYDIVFLYGIGARPNFDYLEKNIGVRDQTQLLDYWREKTSSLDFKDLARDLEPFLFDPRDQDKVRLFPEFLNSLATQPSFNIE